MSDVLVLDETEIVEIGPAERVIRSPQHPYTQALASVSPSPDPHTQGERASRTILEGETPIRRTSRRAVGSTRAARRPSTAVALTNRHC